MTVFNLARPVRLSLSGGMSINAPAGLTFEEGTVATTGFTLSGAASGYTNSPVTYTVTPYPVGSALASTVVLSYYEDPTPTSVPILRGTLTFTAGATAAQTFQITRTTDGTSSVSIASSLAEIGSPISLTTTTAGSGTGDLPTNTLSASSATVVSYGQAFRQGALGAAQGLAGRQINPITYWPADGSVKHAIVSRQIGVGTTSDALAIGTAASGATLTLSDLVTVLTSVSFTSGGTYGTATLSTADLQSSFDWQGGASTSRAWASGPLMSSWIFRKPFSGDSHLVAWMEVRLYRPASGPLQVEVFPWVENGYMFVATPTNKSATYTFSMNGSTRFSGAIDIKHHCRVALLNTSTGEGSATTFSHWLGSDPAGRCIHDRAYFMATKMVPNYGFLDPTNLDALIASNELDQHYIPMSSAHDNSMTGAPGAGSPISKRQVRYLTTGGDIRAWRGMMAHALSAGSWSLHYRDETTNLPFKFSTYPNVWNNGTGSPPFPATSGGGGQNVERPATSHLPGYAYLPFLTTGWFWFMDEIHLISTFAYTMVSYTSDVRDASKGIYTGRVAGASRLAAWSLNTLAHAAAVTPTAHPLQSEFVTSWQHNTNYYRGAYVDGTLLGGAWVAGQGTFGEYGQENPYPTYAAPSAWHGAAFMQNYHMMVWGLASDIGIPQSAESLGNHIAVRDYAYTQAITRAGDGTSGRPKWQRFIAYSWPVGTDYSGMPPDAWFTPSQAYAAQVTAFALNDAGLGATLKVHPAVPFQGGTPQGDGDLVSTSEYGATALAGLSLAVEHNVAGAAEAHGRVLGASNYATAFPSVLRNSLPDSGMVPRLPAYLAGKGVFEWTTVQAFSAATSVHAQNAGPAYAAYGSPKNVIDAWDGGAMRQDGAYFILHGGGHGDYLGNEIYAIRLTADVPTWERVWGPSLYADQVNPPVDDYGTWGYNSDGNPASTHSYYVNQYDDKLGRLMRIMGGPGRGAGGRTPYVDSWSWGAANWNPKGTHPVWPYAPGDGPCTARDPITGEIYVWAGWTRGRLNPAGTSWTYQNSGAQYSYGEMAMVFDTRRGKMMLFGSTSDSYSADWVSTWNPADNTVTRVSTLGVARFQRQMGAAYDPVNDCVWLINKASELLKYDIATNTTSIQATAGSGPLPLLSYVLDKGYFNRFQYSHRLRALVMAPAWAAATFVIRVS